MRIPTCPEKTRILGPGGENVWYMKAPILITPSLELK